MRLIRTGLMILLLILSNEALSQISVTPPGNTSGTGSGGTVGNTVSGVNSSQSSALTGSNPGTNPTNSIAGTSPGISQPGITQPGMTQPSGIQPAIPTNQQPGTIGNLGGGSFGTNTITSPGIAPPPGAPVAPGSSVNGPLPGTATTNPTR